MKSIALLQTLLQQAESARDTALGVLQQAEAMRAHAQSQADQLNAYQQDFDVRWTQRFRQEGSRELLDCRQSFGDRLQEAVSGQQNQVDQLGNRVELARDMLRQREQRVAAVSKLIERRRRDLQVQAERQDQRSSDELAQRLHRQHKAVAR